MKKFTSTSETKILLGDANRLRQIYQIMNIFGSPAPPSGYGSASG